MILVVMSGQLQLLPDMETKFKHETLFHLMVTPNYGMFSEQIFKVFRIYIYQGESSINQIFRYMIEILRRISKLLVAI